MPVLRVEIVAVDEFELAADPVLAGADAAGAAGADVAGLAEGDELPHAVSTAAAPASTGTAHQRLTMTISPFLPNKTFLSVDYVTERDGVHAGCECIRRHSQASDIGYP